ncbi:unnamed protein product, partial [Rotaria sordida]
DQFKVSLIYLPYFYVGTKLGRENTVYAYLSNPGPIKRRRKRPETAINDVKRR